MEITSEEYTPWEMRIKEYDEFLERQLKNEGLKLVLHGYDSVCYLIIKVNKLFGKKVAYIERQPSLSPKPRSSENRLEIGITNPDYEQNIIRVADSVRQAFGIETLVRRI